MATRVRDLFDLDRLRSVRTLAVSDTRDTWTFAELYEHAASFSRMAKAACPCRDRLRVLVQARNSAPTMAAILGTWLAGGVPMLLDPSSPADVVQDHVNLLGPDFFVSSGGPWGNGPATRRLRPRPGRVDLDSDVDLIRFTSGTSGASKALAFTGLAVKAAAQNWIAAESSDGYRAGSLALATVANGLSFNTTVMPSLILGAPIYFLPGLPTQGAVGRAIDAAKPGRVVAFPAYYQALAKRQASARPEHTSVQTWLSAAAPLAAQIIITLRAVGMDVRNYYGTAETGPLTLPERTDDPASVGRALPGVELRASADGEIGARSEAMAKTYVDLPSVWESRFTEDRFYMTGDRGAIRAGVVHLLGRATDYVNVAGRKVDPVRVEQALAGYVASDYAVIGVPDALRGEAVALVTAGAAPPLEHLRANLAGLAAHELPSRTFSVEHLPRTGSGKLQRANLLHLINSLNGAS